MEQIMGDMDIAFPNLGIYLRNVPKTIMVGSFGIALYGIMIAAAMLCGISIAAYMGKKEGQDPDLYWDSFPWIVISSIVGARIYYVIFMWDFYKDNLVEIFNLRGGGLAIYGGIILAVTTIYIYCRLRKADPFLFLDRVAFGLVIGQVIGRWGNFFNREAFGAETEIFCRMGLTTATGETVYVHPTFLYESLWNTAGFVLMSTMLRKGRHRYNGQFLALYFLWYGLGRAFIEGLRTDSLMIPGTAVRVSQVLSILLAAGGAAVLVLRRGTSSAVSDSSSPSP